MSSWYPSEKNPFNGDFIQRNIQYSGIKIKELVFCLVPHNYKKGATLTSVNEFLTEIRWFYKPFNQAAFLSRINAYRRAYHYIVKTFGLPKLIHVHAMFDICFLANLFYSKHKIPFIVTEHFSGLISSNRSFKSTFYRLFVRFYARHAQQLMAVSNFLKTELKKIGFKQKITVLYNVIPPYFFFNGIIQSVQKSNPLKIIHVSSLDEKSKNISGILKAISSISKNHDFEFTIIGNGDNVKLKSKIQELGLSSKIAIKGPFSHEQVAQELRKNDLFILFSHFETLSCVLCEAVVSGVPAIATKVGGIPDVIFSEQMGILIDPKDTQALAREIINFIQNRDNFDRFKIAQLANDRFSLEKYQANIQAIYSSISTQIDESNN